ncbi:MAG TPA: DEAD/DEAH box helicase [Armatimonadetes bacterium]|nr:DEAD/DEAH box helicase [Armatimonadota bacterium]
MQLRYYPHQVETALTVLNRMRGCALLADEVGLGKTIEAGLIMKELLVRGLIRTVLILVPASLTLQWREEMREKFGEEFIIARKASDWSSHNRIIGSLDLAKREPHASAILQRDYDMLIIDEAHKLKNRATLVHRFCNRIRKRYILLLTATPVQNDLIELYNLITLLKPGQFGTLREFKRRYVYDGDPRHPKNPSDLRQLLTAVMIRHHRDEVGITLPPRYATTHTITLPDGERELYEQLTRFIRQQYKHATTPKERHLRLLLIVLQKELCSSPQAVASTLLKMARDDYSHSMRKPLNEFYDMARTIPISRKVLDTVEIVNGCSDKVLIFTDYLPTMRHLSQVLRDAGHRVVTYHGGLSDSARDRAVREFRDDAHVMISTESGAEGRNLQFCRTIINFDLPWNPMRLEQRIGRVHRLGQDREVYVINLATEETVEQHILNLLTRKIRLFELVVGELELMLGAAHIEQSIEHLITEAIMESESSEEEQERLSAIGDVLERAWEKYDRVKQANAFLGRLLKDGSITPTGTPEKLEDTVI